MATSILAVDDSVTMRKIFEITFAGTDFNVVTVASGDAALAKLKSENFGLVISDITLDPNGYELCKQIKAAAPGARVLLLSSRQNPYDNGAGTAAGADDHVDKPFETQQLIDRVSKLLREGPAAAAPAPAPAPAARPAAAPAPAAASAFGAPAAKPTANTLMSAGGAQAARPASAGMGFGAQRPAAAAPAPAAAPAGAKPSPFGPPAGRPAPAAAPSTPAAAPSPAASTPPAATQALSAAVNGQIAAKVGDLGLTPAQVEAVTALTRDVVERIVWEVVPVLAEAMIREEIVRLTK